MALIYWERGGGGGGGPPRPNVNETHPYENAAGVGGERGLRQRELP